MKLKKPTKPKKHTLDIFQVLAAIDQRDFTFLERLSEADRKGFVPTTVLRWSSAISNSPESEAMLWLVNEYANFDFYTISDHPELQFKLLAAAGLGSKFRHQWLDMPKKKGVAGFSVLCDFLLEWHPGASDDEINILLSQFTRETFLDLVHSCSGDKTRTKELIDAWDKYHGVEAKKSR